jgi:hypothetical protein
MGSFGTQMTRIPLSRKTPDTYDPNMGFILSLFKEHPIPYNRVFVYNYHRKSATYRPAFNTSFFREKFKMHTYFYCYLLFDFRTEEKILLYNFANGKFSGKLIVPNLKSLCIKMRVDRPLLTIGDKTTICYYTSTSLFHYNIQVYQTYFDEVTETLYLLNCTAVRYALHPKANGPVTAAPIYNQNGCFFVHQFYNTIRLTIFSKDGDKLTKMERDFNFPALAGVRGFARKICELTRLGICLIVDGSNDLIGGFRFICNTKEGIVQSNTATQFTLKPIRFAVTYGRHSFNDVIFNPDGNIAQFVLYHHSDEASGKITDGIKAVNLYTQT